MALRVATNSMVIGSTTAGADGNISEVPLPGGLSSDFSGLGVFYPDNRPTQRIRIVPDVAVAPTVLGLRIARDEVVEEAISEIIGTSQPKPAISSVANAEGENAVIAPNLWMKSRGQTWQTACVSGLATTSPTEVYRFN